MYIVYILTVGEVCRASSSTSHEVNIAVKVRGVEAGGGGPRVPAIFSAPNPGGI